MATSWTAGRLHPPLGPTTELRRLEGHTGIIRTLAFAANGKVLISTGDDESTKLWDVATGKEITPSNKLASPASA